LLAVLLVALAVRLAGLNAESFTMDEITELRFTHIPFSQIVLLADGFPPLYQMLLKPWLTVWGTPLAARWLSALLGVATVYAVYQLAREVADEGTAVAASLLAAFSPLHVWFAQESRAYALALPLTAFTLWRFWRAYHTRTRRDWIIYAGTAVTTICTHYFAAIIVALQALWILPRLVRPVPDRGAVWLVYGFMAAAALPILLLLRGDLAFQSGTGPGTIGLGEVFYTPYVFLLGFSTGLSVRDLHESGVSAAARSFLPWICAVTACLLPPAVAWLRRTGARMPGIGYLLVMSLGPVVATLAAAGFFGLKYKVSYVSWASIPVLVLLGAAIATTWPRWFTRLGVAGYVALMLIALANRHLDDRYRNEDARAVAAYLAAHGSPETPVLVIAGYMAEPIGFYLGGGWSVRELPDGVEALQVVQNVRHATPRDTWVVYTRPFHGDPDGDVLRGLVGSADAHLASTFAGMDVYRLEGTAVSRSTS
jgi:hypothetical protein